MHSLILGRLLAQLGDDEPPHVAWSDEAACLADGAREDRIANLAAHPWRHRPELGLALGDLARRVMGQSPDQASELAHLALRAVGYAMNEPAIANHIILSGLAIDSSAMALTVLAEAKALELRVDEAMSALVLAKLLAGKGTEDPELEAAVAVAEGVVAFVLHNEETALGQLRRARDIYRELGDTRAEALVEVRCASVLNGCGLERDAFAALARARELDPEEAARAVAVMTDEAEVCGCGEMREM